jgi:phosphomannomutase
LEYIQINEHDFGIMFDGDADRIGMILPDGTIIPGDIITAIIAKILLTDGTADRLGSREIMSDVFSSQTVREVVERHGGIYTMIRVGR